MSGPAEPAGFDAAYWEDRYRGGEGAGRHDPSPSLVSEVDALPPGRALDAGCGVGADALWLASRGWHVTAADVSPSALERGRADTPAAWAARLAWVEADLEVWEPDDAAFDLVTSHFVHVPGPPEALFARLASWVAPGGTLLVVGHAASHGHATHGHATHGHAAGHAGAHGHPPGAQVEVDQVLSVLPPDAWEVLVAEVRTHTLRRPGGGEQVTRDDLVVRAQRRL